MMIMTAKVDIKKIAIIIGAILGVILTVVLLFGGKQDTSETAATTFSDNNSRIKFLKDFGWDVTETPAQSGQVKIPEQQTEVFDRYNALQKSQGYDLSQFAGKTVMRYVYQIDNFPGATEPVYATLLVYKNQIIGGDITNTAAKGVIQGFQKQSSSAENTPTESAPATSAPTESTAA